MMSASVLTCTGTDLPLTSPKRRWGQRKVGGNVWWRDELRDS